MRCREEATYESRATEIIERFRTSPFRADVTPDFDPVCLERPY